MSLMFCEHCSRLMDTDFEMIEGCPCLKKDVMVAPGVYQSKADLEANMVFDEMRDNQD